MSQNYKIVERLNNGITASGGIDISLTTIREAASLIKELGEALETISSIAAGSQTINSFPNIQRIADTVISKLKEA